MDNALTWLTLRDIYFRVSDYPELVKELNLKEALKNHAPTFVPNERDGGDSGDVLFSDGSRILYDWDEGHFVYENGYFDYPWVVDDPLFWGEDEG